MIVKITLYNKEERAVKVIGCKIEHLEEVLEKNKSKIMENETTIEVMPKFIEEMWDKRGTKVMTEEFDGINSIKKEESICFK